MQGHMHSNFNKLLLRKPATIQIHWLGYPGTTGLPTMDYLIADEIIIPKEIEDIKFIDFKKEHNHFCKMAIRYSDGSEQTLISRVIFNEIKNHWVVDGMHVAVRLLE